MSDDVTIKVGIDVNDLQFKNLQKELAENQKKFMKLSPASVLNSKSQNLAPFLGKSFDGSSDKVAEPLKKLIDVSKKESDTLDKILDEAQTKNKKEEKIKEDNDGIGIGGAAGAALALVLTGVQLVQSEFTKKITRELNLAALSFQTGQTVESMAKLNYQAKNVGLSLEQIVQNAASFSNQIFGDGLSDEKAQLYQALGIDLRKELSGAKSAEDVERIQLRIFNKSKKALSQNFGEFQGSIKASELAGIPASQAFQYSHLNSAKNIELAEGLKKERGAQGLDSTKIIETFEILTAKSQQVTASLDKILSTGAAETMAIATANIKAGIVHVIGDILTGDGGKINSSGNQNKELSERLSGQNARAARGVDLYFNRIQPQNVSHSAQTKAGAQ